MRKPCGTYRLYLVAGNGDLLWLLGRCEVLSLPHFSLNGHLNFPLLTNINKAKAFQSCLCMYIISALYSAKASKCSALSKHLT